MESYPNYVESEHRTSFRMQFLPQAAYFIKVFIVHYNSPCKLGEQELRGDASELDVRVVEIFQDS